MNTDSAPYLSQAERLAFAPIACHPIELEEPECVTISSPSNGFRMPSMETVRMNDARLSLFASHGASNDECDDDDETSDEESGDEALASETAYKRRDSMREHSFRLPSQSSRRECLAEMKALGMAWND